MTSHNRRAVRVRVCPAAPLLIGLGIVGAQFVCLSAWAEGSFFKDRQSAAGSQQPAAQQTAAQPKAVPATAPAPVPEPAQAPPDSTGSSASETPPPPVSAPAPAPTVPPPVQQPTRQASSHADVSGAVSEVLSTDTFVVAGQQVQLAGVRGRAVLLTGLRGWLANNGNQLNCHAVGSRYRCSTPNGRDVGQIVLANGAGEVDANAPPEYRAAETQARLAHKGIWSGR